MKRLLNTLYVISSDRYLSLDGENVVVLEKGETVARFPLHNLEGIVTFGYTEKTVKYTLCYFIRPLFVIRWRKCRGSGKGRNCSEISSA